MLVTKQLKNILGTVNFVFTNILQNIFICVQQLKEIYTGLEQLKGE